MSEPLTKWPGWKCDNSLERGSRPGCSLLPSNYHLPNRHRRHVPFRILINEPLLDGRRLHSLSVKLNDPIITRRKDRVPLDTPTSIYAREGTVEPFPPCPRGEDLATAPALVQSRSLGIAETPKRAVLSTSRLLRGTNLKATSTLWALLVNSGRTLPPGIAGARAVLPKTSSYSTRWRPERSPTRLTVGPQRWPAGFAHVTVRVTEPPSSCQRRHDIDHLRTALAGDGTSSVTPRLQPTGTGTESPLPLSKHVERGIERCAALATSSALTGPASSLGTFLRAEAITLDSSGRVRPNAATLLTDDLLLRLSSSQIGAFSRAELTPTTSKHVGLDPMQGTTLFTDSLDGSASTHTSTIPKSVTTR